MERNRPDRCIAVVPVALVGPGEPQKRVRSVDRSLSFAAVLSLPGVEEICELRSHFGFMAFHGGNLERQTDHIAVQAARRSDASVYAVVQPPSLRHHYRSASVVPKDSAALAAFIDHCDVVISVHGYGRHGHWEDLLFGGRNRSLAEHTAAALGPALAAVEPNGYQLVTDLERIPKPLRGVHPSNPVNLPTQCGLQLELPPGVRGLTPQARQFASPFPPVAALIDGLASAASSWTGQRGPVVGTPS